MRNLYKLSLLMAVIVMVLSACGPAATPAPAAPDQGGGMPFDDDSPF